MLRDLRINHFAIIDELQLSFAPGLNVLTGETGAGKSIIMRALGLLCGERAATDLIRSDAPEAELEALFDVGDAGGALLEACGLPPTPELLVRRVIQRSGKGRVHLNGSLATAGVLSQLGSRLIHVFGQHEHALLLKPESHLDLLDEFGRLGEPRARMTDAYEQFREVADHLAAVTASSEATRQRLDLLRFQVKELREAEPTPGESAALRREREVQRHAERLTQICQQSESALYSGDDAMAAGLGRVIGHLRDAGRIDPRFAGNADALQQAAAQIEDVALELRRAMEHIRHDPERLEQIDERLALLSRLQRKYGCEADELAERLTQLEAELAGLEGSGIDAATLRQELRARATHAWSVARELSRARQAAGVQLELRMAEELRTLGMRGGTFRVVFTVCGSDAPQAGWADAATPGASRLNGLGADVIEFYLSANPGEDPKSLARIASGGELSRIMLALKTLTAAAGEVPTLIFDEVDAGIGGAVAEAVGKRLRTLGRSRQILCITHLPQIAAQADHHFAVEKRVASGRTMTTARALASNDRISELARMLGGSGTAESLRYARRLIQNVEKSDAG